MCGVVCVWVSSRVQFWLTIGFVVGRPRPWKPRLVAGGRQRANYQFTPFQPAQPPFKTQFDRSHHASAPGRRPTDTRGRSIDRSVCRLNVLLLLLPRRRTLVGLRSLTHSSLARLLACSAAGGSVASTSRSRPLTPIWVADPTRKRPAGLDGAAAARTTQWPGCCCCRAPFLP